MNLGQLVKTLGWICVLAGIARIGMTPTAIIWGTDSVQELTFGLIACILMSVGTIVTYMVQSEETGGIGLIATLGIIIGNIVTTAMVWTVFVFGGHVEMPDGPVVTISRVVSMAGFLGGTLVFAYLTFRARVFPRWVAGLQLAIVLSMFLPLEDNQWFAAVWGLAYVGMGYCIVADRLNKKTAGLHAEGLKM